MIPFQATAPSTEKQKNLLQRYQNYLNDARESFESARNQVIVEIEEIKNRYEMDQSSWANTLHKVNMTAKTILQTSVSLTGIWLTSLPLIAMRILKHAHLHPHPFSVKCRQLMKMSSNYPN